MGKSYFKSIARTFRSTKSRFLSVFGIVALGVGFLAGLSGTPVDMKNSVERYLDDGNFYDVRVLYCARCRACGRWSLPGPPTCW